MNLNPASVLDFPTESKEPPDDVGDPLELYFDADLCFSGITRRAAERLGFRVAPGIPIGAFAAALGAAEGEAVDSVAYWLRARIAAAGGESFFRTGRLGTGGNAGWKLAVTFHELAGCIPSIKRLDDEKECAMFLADFSSRALAGTPLPALCDAACAGLPRHVRAGAACVLHFRVEQQAAELVSASGMAGNPQETSLFSLAAGTWLDAVLRAGRPVVSLDFPPERSGMGAMGPAAPEISGERVRSAGCALIGPTGRPWGALVVFRLGPVMVQPISFSENEITAIGTIAGNLAAVIRNSLMEISRIKAKGLLHGMLDSVPALIATFDKNLNYRFCNTAYAEWFRLPREQILNRPMQEILGESAMKAIRPHVDRVLTGEACQFEKTIPHFHGGDRDMIAYYMPQQADGVADGFFAIVLDVTERKRAEAQLREMNELLEQRVRQRTQELEVVSANVPAFFALIGTDFRYRFANKAYEDLFKIPRGKIVGMAVQDLLGEEQFKMVEWRIRDVLAGKRPDPYTTTLHFPGREPIVTRCRHMPQTNADGSVGGVFVLSVDITMERDLEVAILAAADRERENVARELHDSICQELSGISILIKTLEQRLESIGHPEASSASEIGRLVRGSAENTRRIAHGLSLIPAGMFGLRDSIETLLGSLKKEAEDCCFELAFDCDESRILPEIRGQLFLICREAVGNAVRHARPLLIRVELRCDLTEIRLVVTDNGGKMPPMLDWNSGIGLRSMAYRAQLLGGTLDAAADQHSTGVQVRCRIPLDPQKPNPEKFPQNP